MQEWKMQELKHMKSRPYTTEISDGRSSNQDVFDCQLSTVAN